MNIIATLGRFHILHVLGCFVFASICAPNVMAGLMFYSYFVVFLLGISGIRGRWVLGLKDTVTKHGKISYASVKCNRRSNPEQIILDAEVD